MKGGRQRASVVQTAREERSGVYTVSQLNRATRVLLNEHYGRVWVQGEISNLALPSSGHCYFSLRDAEAQVRCAMFRSQSRSLGAMPQNGDQVLVQAQVSLYEPRGDYQLIVDYLEPVGDGQLRRAFEILKQRLAAEGLFDAAHKKPIPALPRTVGVITSPTGAAIHDILTVLGRRFPAIGVIIFPTKVQGAEAKGEIVAALDAADRSGLCDVLLLARGGGSLEDLWPFNEEMVARALHGCQTPVVTGIGHEIDFTIADWVADLRAATPSAAAEAVSPDARDWLLRFQQRESDLRKRFVLLLQRREQQLTHIEKRLEQAHPLKRIATQRQRIDELELRLRRAVDVWLAGRRGHLDAQTHRLLRHQPTPAIELYASRVAALHRRLQRDVWHGFEVRRAHLQSLERRLALVSPLATLQRGYAVLSRESDGSLVTNAADLAPGDATLTRLARGIVYGRVEATET
jgi:exodeoxyribonuclease VII large subunit